MTWNYRVIKTYLFTHYVYKVVEVYYDEFGTITGWADCTDTILMNEEYEDLKGTAEYVLKAFERPVLLHTLDDDKLVEFENTTKD